MPKKKRMPKVSQSVKQNQTVKINIQNLLPKLREREPRGDYIAPKRGMPMGNLNMGSQTRLVGPSIQYAVRPPEFLPLPERFNSQGQPSYVREAPARVGRPDLIYQETNPSDIEPSKAPLVAIAPQPIPKVEKNPIQPRSASDVYNEYEARARAAVYGPRIQNPMAPAAAMPRQLYVDSPEMDESQDLVAHQAGPSARSMAQRNRRARERVASSSSAAMTGEPPVSPALMASPNYPGGIEPRINPERMGQIYGTPPKGVPRRRIIEDEDEE